MNPRYTCTHCRTPFNTEPYVKREKEQGGEIFCQRNCYEEWLRLNGSVPQLQVQPHIFHRGTHIKRRH